MDKLGDTISNLSMYDVKAYVRKAQNAVLNFSDMESKVREATNNEPWGTSTSLMQEIAEGTNSYQQFHEIMPFVYRRFTEKSASEWRQIYKALQLLEYLVKNGSERVVDYARSHTAVIDLLRQFQYTDSSGRDQGINIRNRAEELLSLLSSTDKLRNERKRSKQLNQRTGVGAGRTPAALGSSTYGESISSSSSRYSKRPSRSKPSSSGIKFGGGGYDQTVYGDGGGFDGSNYQAPTSGSFQDDGAEEYVASRTSTDSKVLAEPAPVAAPEPDLLSFGDDSFSSKPAAPASASSVSRANASQTAPAANAHDGGDDDDDFDDFQSAPVSSAPIVDNNSILGLFSAAGPSAAPSQPTSAFTSTPKPGNTDIFSSMSSIQSNGAQANVQSPSAVSAAPAKSDAFSSLWDIGKTSSSAPATKPASNTAPIVPSQTAVPAPQPKQQFNGDDLLMF